MSQTAADARAERRSYIRRHHPDVGGDPAAFRAGLAARRAALVGSGGPVPADPLTDDPRLDAPIVAVPSGIARRVGRRIGRSVGRYGRRLARRYDLPTGASRVL